MGIERRGRKYHAPSQISYPSLLFPVPHLLSPSSVKPLLFFLPPLPFLVWSKAGMEHNPIPGYGVKSVTTIVVIPLRTKGMQAGKVKQGQTMAIRGSSKNSWSLDCSAPGPWEHELDRNN